MKCKKSKNKIKIGSSIKGVRVYDLLQSDCEICMRWCGRASCIKNTMRCKSCGFLLLTFLPERSFAEFEFFYSHTLFKSTCRSTRGHYKFLTFFNHRIRYLPKNTVFNLVFIMLFMFKSIDKNYELVWLYVDSFYWCRLFTISVIVLFSCWWKEKF